MAMKKTIYFAGATEAFLGVIDSGRVNQALDRYAELLRRERIEKLFTEAEWSALRDMLNGTISEPASLIRGSLAQGWADAQADGIAQKWGVATSDMQVRLRELSFAQELAVVEAVESWWRAQA